MDFIIAGLFFSFLDALRVIWTHPETKARSWSLELRIVLLCATFIAFMGIGVSIFRAVSNIPPLAEIQAMTKNTPLAPMFEDDTQ
jgi:hypothetical protein